MHVFFGEIAARFIGWADSPFQAEVGFASLGFAAIGFLAFRGDRGHARRGRGRTVRVPARRCGRPHLPDDHGAQFRARQCRHHLLDRHLVPAIGFALLWLERKYPAERRAIGAAPGAAWRVTRRRPCRPGIGPDPGLARYGKTPMCELPAPSFTQRLVQSMLGSISDTLETVCPISSSLTLALIDK